MAVAYPSNWRGIQTSGAAQRELETLEALTQGLPAAYTVYHRVHWQWLESDSSFFDDLDFVICSPRGQVLLIEQVSGLLLESDAGLGKKSEGQNKLFATSLARTASRLNQRFILRTHGRALNPDVLLYCPDHRVARPEIAGLAPERIVDSSQRGGLVAKVLSILPADPPASLSLAKDPVEAVHRFFTDLLELVPDVSAMLGHLESNYLRLTHGLVHWARQLSFTPFRLRIQGTAGCGKSQLALAVLQDAKAQGLRALFVCYNRPLADHMSQLVKGGAHVATYHQLCDQVLSESKLRPDFSQAQAFQQLENLFSDFVVGPQWHFDVLVVDEGQDFSQAWVEPLLRLLKPEGQAWWMEDPDQNLYSRPPVALPHWAVMKARQNYRSPRDLVRFIAEALPSIEPIEPLGGLEISDLEVFTFRDPQTLSSAEPRTVIDATKRAITRAVGLGFRRSQIAVLTFRGRDHSAFTHTDALGPHRLRRFTGKYDLLSNPVFSEGDVLIESIYRFKGQSAACVVLTELDFESLDPATQRKLFVGMTRASLKLILVASDRAAQKLGVVKQ